MPIHLLDHQKQYNLACSDVFFTFRSGFSGALFAKRHWDLSFYDVHNFWYHRIIACIEYVPVIGGIVALIEMLVIKFLNSLPFVHLPHLDLNRWRIDTPDKIKLNPFKDYEPDWKKIEGYVRLKNELVMKLVKDSQDKRLKKIIDREFKKQFPKALEEQKGDVEKAFKQVLAHMEHNLTYVETEYKVTEDTGAQIFVATLEKLIKVTSYYFSTYLDSVAPWRNTFVDEQKAMQEMSYNSQLAVKQVLARWHLQQEYQQFFLYARSEGIQPNYSFYHLNLYTKWGIFTAYFIDHESEFIIKYLYNNLEQCFSDQIKKFSTIEAFNLAIKTIKGQLINKALNEKLSINLVGFIGFIPLDEEQYYQIIMNGSDTRLILHESYSNFLVPYKHLTESLSELGSVYPFQFIHNIQTTKVTQQFNPVTQNAQINLWDTHLYLDTNDGVLIGILSSYYGEILPQYVLNQLSKLFFSKLRAFDGNVHQVFEAIFHIIQTNIKKRGQLPSDEHAIGTVCYIDKTKRLLYTVSIGGGEANFFKKNETSEYRCLPLTCHHDINMLTRDEIKKNAEQQLQIEGNHLNFNIQEMVQNTQIAIRTFNNAHFRLLRGFGLVNRLLPCSMTSHKPEISVHKLEEGILVLSSELFSSALTYQELLNLVSTHNNEELFNGVLQYLNHKYHSYMSSIRNSDATVVGEPNPPKINDSTMIVVNIVQENREKKNKEQQKRVNSYRSRSNKK